MLKPAPAPIAQSPLHPFGLAAKAQPIEAGIGVWANELPLAGFVSLRGNVSNAAFTAAAAKALGFALPLEPCTFVQSNGTSALWLSPDEWMIIVPRPGHTAAVEALTGALVGIRSQVADNSGGYTQVALLGRNARDVLSHCTVYDLDHLSEGRVVGTTFGKMSAYIRRDGEGYTVLLRRSFADYIWRYLERAAEPYGFGIAALTPDSGARS